MENTVKAGSANTLSNTGIGVTTTIVNAELISFQIENEEKDYKNFMNKNLTKNIFKKTKNETLSNGEDFN